MKRIIPLLAVAVAMAVPVTLSAQLQGYNTAQQTVLIDWVKDAIDAGNIHFTTNQTKTDFLDLYDDLCNAAAQSDWSTCVTIAGQLKSAAGNIVGDGKKTLVMDLCDYTEDLYSDPGSIFVITPADATGIQNDLNQFGDADDSLTVFWGHHLEAGNPEDDEIICTGIWLDEDTYFHFTECTQVYNVADD